MGEQHYDIIIIGTEAGGGTLAHRLAPTGKKILILERGGFLPREKENWNAKEVYQKERYHTHETWYNREGKPFRPGPGYWVGGNTKVYGAALLRMREKDFDKITHYEGTSPAWPLSYWDFDPETSVLDLNCRTHEVNNLYVVDGSFFPSNAGVNPTLTIIANALRVGDHLQARMQ